jgi:hypothetical protein
MATNDHNQGGRQMTRAIPTIAFAMIFALGASAPVLAETSEADCKAMYEKVDTNNVGHIEGDPAKPYLEAMEKAGLQPAEADKLTQAEFADACAQDVFKDVPKED